MADKSILSGYLPARFTVSRPKIRIVGSIYYYFFLLHNSTLHSGFVKLVITIPSGYYSTPQGYENQEKIKNHHFWWFSF